MNPKGAHPAKGWAAAYGRVSLAMPHLNQDSPENHIRVNRQTAATHSLKIKPGYEFYDHGIAGSKNVRLPDLERAIKTVVNREVEALIVPAIDRLSRRGMRHVSEILDAVETAGGRIIFGKECLDSGNPPSRAIIAFLAEQARTESRALAWRMEVWHEGCRLKGKWTGKRPYGYQATDGKLIPHPDEAPVVRRIIADLLNGQTCRQIAKALNDEGVRSPGSAKSEEILAQGREPKNRPTTWGMSTIINLMHNPALAGWRQHRGKVVLGPDDEPISFGDGILTPSERACLLAELDRRTAVVKGASHLQWIGRRTGSGRPAMYLLSGIAVCETCGYHLFGFLRRDRGGSFYRCSSTIQGYVCAGRAHIKAAIADEEVRRQLTARLAAIERDDPILAAIARRCRLFAMTDDEVERADIENQLAGVRNQIVSLEEARYVRGEFATADEVARWEMTMGHLKAHRDAINDALDELGPHPDFDIGILLDTYLNRDAWDAAPLAQRRELLEVAVDKVIIAPAHRRRVSPSNRVRVWLAGESSDEERAGGGPR
jgi:site-specific DNA recombinase